MKKVECDTQVTLLTPICCVSCLRKIWSKFCELQSLFWRSCHWKSLPNSVSSVTQNILKWGQSLILMVKKIAKFKKAKSLPSSGPPPLPCGSVQTVSAFLSGLWWARLNSFIVQGTRHQHKLKKVPKIALCCGTAYKTCVHFHAALAWIEERVA